MANQIQTTELNGLGYYLNLYILFGGISTESCEQRYYYYYLFTPFWLTAQVSVNDTVGQLSAWLNIESYVVAVSDDPTKGQPHSLQII